MQRSQLSLFARHDTFFGVCEAVGQDFGFNPNWLRIAFAVSLLAAPVITLATYLGLGFIVLLSRWLFPRRPAPTEESLAGAIDRSAALEPDNDGVAPSLAEAA